MCRCSMEQLEVVRADDSFENEPAGEVSSSCLAVSEVPSRVEVASDVMNSCFVDSEVASDVLKSCFVDSEVMMELNKSELRTISRQAADQRRTLPDPLPRNQSE